MNENQSRAIATVVSAVITGVPALALGAGPWGIALALGTGVITWGFGDVAYKGTRALILSEELGIIRDAIAKTGPSEEELNPDQRTFSKIMRLAGFQSSLPVAAEKPKEQSVIPLGSGKAQEAVLPAEPTQVPQSVPEQYVEAPGEDSMFLSRTLFPHANAVFSNRVAILGIPGAGKSNTVAVFAEELGKFGAPLVIFDTENEYRPLCAKPYFHRPFAANCNNVDLEMAFSFGQRIMDERLQVVLNLDSYDDDDRAALIMIDIIKGIQKWEEALANDDRIPCAVILDEAAVWLPQNGKESMLSKQKDEDGYTTLDKLQKVFFSVVVRRGRKRGIGFILASQRSAEIDKRAIASAQWKFLHLQNQPNDLEVYADFGVDKVTAQALRQGEAFVIGPGVKGVHQLRKRNSTDNAKTPGLESLRKRRYTESLAGKAAQMTLPVLPVIEPARVVESRPIEQSHMSHYPSPKLNPTLERALKFYNEGYDTSRPLAEKMHVGKDTANGYIQQLKARKLV